jgi:two-component system, NtrC family, response regulator AtoC
VVLLDVQLPDGYGPNLLYETAHLAVRPPIILITAYGDIDMAVDAMKNGAHDFLTKPVQFPQLERSIQRATEVIRLRRELAHLRETQHQKSQFVVGNNPQMKSVIAQAQRAASASVSVLITGETGTGKEVLARFIHSSGPRSSKPFIAINCAAIQNTMLESELFGYEAGAFTGLSAASTG